MEKRKFDTMKNGYNRYQVDDFLQTQELLIDSLQKKLDVQQMCNEQLRQEKERIQRQYQEVCDNLSMKEKAAGEIARMAMKEANMIVDTANQNADTIVREALMMARSILLDIARLGNEASDLKESMREELMKIGEALDEFETPAIPNMDLLKKEI